MVSQYGHCTVEYRGRKWRKGGTWVYQSVMHSQCNTNTRHSTVSSRNVKISPTVMVSDRGKEPAHSCHVTSPHDSDQKCEALAV